SVSAIRPNRASTPPTDGCRWPAAATASLRHATSAVPATAAPAMAMPLSAPDAPLADPSRPFVLAPTPSMSAPSFCVALAASRVPLTYWSATAISRTLTVLSSATLASDLGHKLGVEVQRLRVLHVVRLYRLEVLDGIARLAADLERAPLALRLVRQPRRLATARAARP